MSVAGWRQTLDFQDSSLARWLASCCWLLVRLHMHPSLGLLGRPVAWWLGSKSRHPKSQAVDAPSFLGPRVQKLALCHSTTFYWASSHGAQIRGRWHTPYFSMTGVSEDLGVTFTIYLLPLREMCRNVCLREWAATLGATLPASGEAVLWLFFAPRSHCPHPLSHASCQILMWAWFGNPA